MPINNKELAVRAMASYERGDQYILGAFGNRSTRGFVEYKKKQYSYNRRVGSAIVVDPAVIAVDCIGLIKMATWDNMNGQGNYYPSEDWNTEMAYRQATVKGTSLKDIPRMVGVVVHKPGHVGVVVDVSAEDPRDWLVVDAYGAYVDLRLTTIGKAGIWKDWFKYPTVEYSVKYKTKTPAEAPGGGAPAVDGGDTYTVKKGDSPWRIAQNELGDGTRYREIMQLNGLPADADIFAGQVLKLPQKFTKMYTVRPGDSPWRIAERQLGNGARYPEILQLNGLNSTDPIYANQMIRIPLR